MNETCVVPAYGLDFNSGIVEGSVLTATQMSQSHVGDLSPVVDHQGHQWELVQHYSRSGICHKYPLQELVIIYFLTHSNATHLSNDLGLAR